MSRQPKPKPKYHVPLSHSYVTYYLHYACFKCRKTFRRHAALSDTHCPECGSEMRSMGRYFKAPRQRDIKAWRVIKMALQQHIGLHHKDVFPGTMRELRDVKRQ